MQRISKKYIVSFGILLTLLVCAFWLGRQYDLQQSAEQAKQQVTQLSRYLDTELARFTAIPHLVTDNQLLSGLIHNNDKSASAVNNYLADIQQSSGASDVYVLNLKGDVVASSNWQLDYSYIGNNFAFRPYFYEAVAGRKVAYFALGLRSNERGIYFSEPIYEGENIIGVVALKVNVSKFENDRLLLNASQTSHFYLTLSDGVIAMSSKAQWRLNTLRLFSETELEKLISKRSYLNHIPKKIATFTSHAQEIELLNIKQDTEFTQFVFAESKIKQLDAKMTGLAMLEQVRAFDSELPVIFLTGFADVSVAVKAMQLGAYDLFEKPLNEQLLDCLARACDKRALVMENRALKLAVEKTSAPGVRILGDTPQMQHMMHLLNTVIDTPADVMIEGETGTGKELVARYLHDQSNRSNCNFVAINCGAVPEQLIESELFGAASGAYTGATQSRKGKFEFAQGGTLFLDEIESTPMSLQIKLLRVLEERKVTPVGENTPIDLDVRIVAATKVELLTLVDEGKFRADLYYRLNLVKVSIPALRDRKADIPLLFKHFSSIAATRFHKPPAPLNAQSQQYLLQYDWPGNVRELRNQAERAVLLGADLAFGANNVNQSTPPMDLSLAEKVSFYEQSLLEEALERNQGSIKQTMQTLQLARKTLYDKMSKYGLNKDMFKD